MLGASELTLRSLAPEKRAPFRPARTPGRDSLTLTMRQASLSRHADWVEA